MRLVLLMVALAALLSVAVIIVMAAEIVWKLGVPDVAVLGVSAGFMIGLWWCNYAPLPGK